MKVIQLLPLIATYFLLTTNSNADTELKLEPTLGPYTTEENSTTQKSTFSLNEKPFTFIQFNPGDLNTDRPMFLKWVWQFGQGPSLATVREKITNFDDNPLNLWNSLDNWDLYKKVGNWSVKVNWWNGLGSMGSGIANFVVTPEPVSSLLFLVGGVTLAATRLRKKKHSA